MKKVCAVAGSLFFLKKNKSFRFLLFFSYFAYSEHILKSRSGTFSLPMAYICIDVHMYTSHVHDNKVTLALDQHLHSRSQRT